MMFEDMAKSSAAWLSGHGKEALVVLSSRVRLARNVAGCGFPSSADSETRSRIVGYFDSTRGRSEVLSDGLYYGAGEINGLDNDFLVERHLISPTFLNGEESKALYIDPEERVSIMVNEEDHLRIQALTPGLDPHGAYELASKYDVEIGRHLEYDYDQDFGYLTACPTNAGTGMRASVLIHLPGLVLTREIDKVVSHITRSGLVVRGSYGEGSDEDKIWRAYGILKHARVLTSEEVMNLLSAVRLGHAMKVIDFLDVALINDMLLLSQPAHLQKFYGREMDSNQRDFVRAQMVREKLRKTDN
jgi:protein arginine kinase